MSYYKANDNHLYKVLKGGYVLHVNYSNALMNILSPDRWAEINNTRHLTQVTQKQFDQKAKAVISILSSHLYE